jgi:hypothetical protein
VAKDKDEIQGVDFARVNNELRILKDYGFRAEPVHRSHGSAETIVDMRGSPRVHLHVGPLASRALVEASSPTLYTRTSNGPDVAIVGSVYPIELLNLALSQFGEHVNGHLNQINGMQFRLRSMIQANLGRMDNVFVDPATSSLEATLESLSRLSGGAAHDIFEVATATVGVLVASGWISEMLASGNIVFSKVFRSTADAHDGRRDTYLSAQLLTKPGHVICAPVRGLIFSGRFGGVERLVSEIDCQYIDSPFVAANMVEALANDIQSKILAVEAAELATHISIIDGRDEYKAERVNHRIMTEVCDAAKYISAAGGSVREASFGACPRILFDIAAPDGCGVSVRLTHLKPSGWMSGHNAWDLEPIGMDLMLWLAKSVTKIRKQIDSRYDKQPEDN